MTRAFAVGKRAHRLGAFIFIRQEEVVQAFMAEGFKEPFAINPCLGRSYPSVRQN